MPKVHVLRAAHKSVHAQHNGGLVECYRCEFPVAVGQLVITKRADRHTEMNGLKVYHAKCWESMFFEAA